MTSDIALLRAAAEFAIGYAEAIDDRHATPTREAIGRLTELDGPLPDDPTDPAATLAILADIGGPATIGSTGANYFGFVNGATYPVALGTSMIVNAWDQNAALPVMSPVAAKLHDITRRWLNELLGLPIHTDVAFVTGATVANASCLAAARDALLLDHGWDVQADGLFGAPEITVIIGAKAHSTLRKSLGLVGLGRDRVTIIPADDQGRLQADLMPDPGSISGPVLVCAQAGEVNTGAFDPFDPLADWVAEHGSAWLHVDGAFGLWALADPSRSGLVRGPDSRRLTGDRRPQVAQRHLRLRNRVRHPIRLAAPHVRRRRRLPAAGSRLRGDAPHTPIVATCPPDRGVVGAAHTGAFGGRPAGAGRIRLRRGDRRSTYARRASRSSMMSCSTRCWCACTTARPPSA